MPAQSLTRLAARLRAWPARLRPMPDTWWAERQAGRTRPWHELAAWRRLGDLRDVERGVPPNVGGKDVDTADFAYEALADLRRSLFAGGPVAILVAGLFGYWLARAGFAPVEAMRRGAAELTLTAGGGQRLPVPATRDEIQRLAETLNEMIERLERSFERERRFVADASHELRTPIAVVKTELEAALLVGGQHPRVAQSLRAAVDECDSLAQLAEDLLVIARTTETGIPLAKEPVPVSRLLDDTRHRFVDRAARHRQTIDVDLPENLNVVADPVRQGAGTITLRGRANSAAVHLDVVDEGPGFGPDIAGRAFERFARGAHARGQGGAGLGLPIVRTLESFWC